MPEPRTPRQAASRAGAGDVLASYTDGTGVARLSPPDTVRAVREAIAAATNAPAPCVINANSRLIHLPPPLAALARPACRSLALHLDDGSELPLTPSRAAQGLTLRAARPIPLGVHRLPLGPRHLYILSRPNSLARVVQASGRRTALFLPLYAVTPGGPFGLGTYTDLRTLCRWADTFDHALIGTLPLFPAFLDSPFDPSPYAPVTRLMWSELFVDPARAPEWAALPASLRHARPVHRDHVDYRRAWRSARRTLGAMARAARSSPARWAQVLASCSAETLNYARFRAINDASGEPWQRWPRAWRSLEHAPIRERDLDFYVYAQSIASDQMHALSRSRGPSSPLYLDLPVGVHASGFDTYCRPDLFLEGFSAGAPPDDLNAQGQTWGFPPMHPTAGRADGYAHLRSVLRRMLAVAGAIRIDHVMGLYRMFCVPHGHDGSTGAYVRYPEDELFAVLLIEAARAGAMVVGEDLGTVPASVRQLMSDHGLLGMHVQQFAFAPGDHPIRPPGAHAIACLNTHDTPTFAGFWHADDIALRVALGHTSESQGLADARGRAALRRTLRADLRRRSLTAASAPAVAQSLTRLHARSASPLVVINLEDLWGEHRPQNVPGTSTQYPNWRRKAAMPMPRLLRSKPLAAALKTIAKERKARP